MFAEAARRFRNFVAAVSRLETRLRSNAQFTAIWQSEGFYERKFLMRAFGPYISEHILDGKHEIVLDNSILIDGFIYSQDPTYYAKFDGKNAFLVQVGDEYFELGVDLYKHFRGVFRTNWSSVFNPQHVVVIPNGFSIDPPETQVRATDRKYAWSFVGEAGKSSRPDMVRNLSTIEPHICFSSTPVGGVAFFDRGLAGKRRIPKEDFVEILRQSAFAPAPMGNASLESVRLYDALESGAIPIVERRLTLDYFKEFLGKHPLPTVDSWSEGRGLIVRYLNDPAGLDALQQECISWWENYQGRLIERIGELLEERSQGHDALVPLRSHLPELPLWQYIELSRHHNLTAMGRRLTLQMSRLIHKKSWRLAHRKGKAIVPNSHNQ
jgi:hypothetical protein